MIKSLRRKFVVITMALVAVILLAVFFGIWAYYAGTLRTQSYEKLKIAMERPFGERPPNFQIGGHLPKGFALDPVFVVRVDGEGAAHLLSAMQVDVDEDVMQAVAALVLEGGEGRGELAAYNLRYQVHSGGPETIIGFIDMTLEKVQLHNMLLVTGLSVAGALLVFFGVSLFLARWALRPVEHAWQNQKRFVADASHELKTPLTVILANTGILKTHPEQTVAEQMTWVENTEQEARRMKGLVDDLLFLAKGDDTEQRLPLAPVDLSELAATMALSFEPVAYEQGVLLDTEVEPGVTVQGNAPQLQQLAGILLDNAVKYAEKGSAVRLCLARRGGAAELSVFNRGRPIGPEEKKHLFERFYRADFSRSREGYGLGLSIAKAIADRHRGRIEVDSGEAGTTFTASLPVG